MFSLTVEHLSRYEYKPSKKEELKAQQKRQSREYGRLSDVSSSGALSEYRSSGTDKRSKSRLSQLLGLGKRRDSVASGGSVASSRGSITSNCSTNY